MNSFPKIAVLASGQGTNLQAILDAAAARQLPAEIRVVISDRKNAIALERAKKAGVESLYVSSKEYSSREAFDAGMVEKLRERQVDWIVLAGFMRILSAGFIRAYRGRILNIHPSLLPHYPGLESIQRAHEAGEKEVGVTVHFVDEGVDTGPVILQDSISVRSGETLEVLTERVHALEHRLYPEAIRLVLSGQKRYEAVS